MLVSERRFRFIAVMKISFCNSSAYQVHRGKFLGLFGGNSPKNQNQLGLAGYFYRIKCFVFLLCLKIRWPYYSHDWL